MNLLFHIPPENLTETYLKVKRILSGHDSIIFDAMTEISPTFKLPNEPGEFNQKHREIERIIGYPYALKGREIALQLMNKIYHNIMHNGGVPGVDSNTLLNAISFKTNVPNIRIFLTNDFYWAVEWAVNLNFNGINDVDKIVLDLYDDDWNEIVPPHIIQYIHSAVLSYQQKINAVSVALLSIAFEGTLRDVLFAKGYSFEPGASSVDVYPYVKANIGFTENCYTLSFNGNMPKKIDDFNVSSCGSPNIEVEIRRVINKNKNRIDLLIKAPSALIDHFSLNVPSQLARKRVNGGR
jgi:hypothetical protein